MVGPLAGTHPEAMASPMTAHAALARFDTLSH
jgi:hypothetical protein